MLTNKFEDQNGEFDLAATFPMTPSRMDFLSRAARNPRNEFHVPDTDILDDYRDILEQFRN